MLKSKSQRKAFAICRLGDGACLLRILEIFYIF